MNRKVMMALMLVGISLAACGSSSSGCDPSPATLTGSCSVASAGQCVDYDRLGNSDRQSLIAFCARFGGTWTDNGLCPAQGRLGTCALPPTTPNSQISCSPQAKVNERYYPPHEDATTAQSQCNAVTGTTWTPG